MNHDLYQHGAFDNSTACPQVARTHKKISNGKSLRRALGALALAVPMVLAACGGGDGKMPDDIINPPATRYQIISFGDSLSDVGTYAPMASKFGGGRFTTNPGQVWTQVVANYYGATLNPAFTGGFGVPIKANPDGYGYAQGGSRVADPAGEGNLPNNAGAITLPVAAQVQSFLATHGNFKPNQIILLNGGGNDIKINERAVAENKITPAMAADNVRTAASELAGLAGSIVQAGGRRVVVVNVSDVGKTPLGLTRPDSGVALTQLTVLFNDTLAQVLRAHQPEVTNAIITVDAFSFFNRILASYQAEGFVVSNTAVACNLSPPYNSSLFCSPQVYAVPNADQTYMFADEVHPTTRLHARFAAYVQERLATVTH
ncbi:SGNH/GDSL hydrolase family protein [Mycoavidus cysteinexigens]|nr:SGNH/GDSL hydrolase family protein [Mycoavidus cysteinexigens]GAM53535.1 phospholipase/lecithinase/hemolysin [bacterium endosymbiont of Mortierella elongata FMR23-6]